MFYIVIYNYMVSPIGSDVSQIFACQHTTTGPLGSNGTSYLSFGKLQWLLPASTHPKELWTHTGHRNLIWQIATTTRNTATCRAWHTQFLFNLEARQVIPDRVNDTMTDNILCRIPIGTIIAVTFLSHINRMLYHANHNAGVWRSPFLSLLIAILGSIKWEALSIIGSKGHFSLAAAIAKYSNWGFGFELLYIQLTSAVSVSTSISTTFALLCHCTSLGFATRRWRSLRMYRLCGYGCDHSLPG